MLSDWRKSHSYESRYEQLLKTRNQTTWLVFDVMMIVVPTETYVVKKLYAKWLQSSHFHSIFVP